jgi:hypothetical protein
MAKKKGSKKGSKKATPDAANGMEILIPEDKIQYQEAQLKSLEVQLAHRVETCVATTTEYNTTKESLAEVLNKYEKEKESTVGLTRDMTRQYKGMQDNLLNKINDREQVIQKLTDTLSKTKAQHENEMKEKNAILQEKDELISKQKDKMEEMCENFASMLRDVTQQLLDRIENSDYSQNKVPIQQVMNAEEYNYKSIIK